MKLLIQICFLLLIVPLIGKQILPNIFGAWFIQWLSFALLSVLVPYGFAKSTLINRDLKYSSSFLLCFIINVLLTSIGLNTLKGTNDLLLAQPQILSVNTSLEAINNKNPDVRKTVAQLVFKEFGQPIMYKTKTDEFKIYQPTVEDRKQYEYKYILLNQTKATIKNIKFHVKETTYLLIWSCLSFLVIFVNFFRLHKNNKS